MLKVFFMHALNRFIKKLCHVLEAVLVHFIDHRYLSNCEVNNTSSSSYTPVFITSFGDLLLYSFCFFQVCCCFQWGIPARLKRLYQHNVIQDCFCVWNIQFVQNLVLQIKQVIQAGRYLNDKFIASFFNLRSHVTDHVYEHLVFETLESHSEVYDSKFDAHFWHVMRVCKLSGKN